MMIETIIGKQFPQVVTPIVSAAKKNIDIVVFDWRWYPEDIGSSCQIFNNAIIQAQRRGVLLRVITNTAATVKVLNENGVQARKWLSSRIMHAKMIVIDGRSAILGSHNYTMNAFCLNQELSILVEHEEFCEKLTAFFENLWSL